MTRFALVSLLQWSHESSLPVSMTMETFCGGVPTVMEIVRLTLWLNRSLLGGLGRYPDGITCDFSGKVRVLASHLVKDVPRIRRMARLKHGVKTVWLVHVILGLIIVMGFVWVFRKDLLN
ncbi:hypothetical protein V8G54_018057 [Vigna mungo]|uniref:Uncharacterized protein n=1 Tax=Vigna mungo TaxID=3915 RepID=A0AAQ3RUE5_VIGMU